MYIQPDGEKMCCISDDRIREGAVIFIFGLVGLSRRVGANWRTDLLHVTIAWSAE